GRGSKNGTGEAAMFNTPNGLAVDGAGVIYVADTDNSTVRRITSSGVVTTWAGVAGVDGVNNGPGTMARFNRPYGIAAKADGTLFIADTASNLIRQITPAGDVTTLAGSVGQTSLTNGTGTAASFNLPTGLAYDAANGGVLYIADTGNKVIRKIASGAVVTTLATGFGEPIALALSPDGSQLYVADNIRHTISRITVSNGVVALFAGSSGVPGDVDGAGTDARFNSPRGLAFDPAGNLYVSEAEGNRIRKITTGGVVSTLAGSGTIGGTDGVGTAARFLVPTGLVYHAPTSRVIVADSINSRIRWLEVSTATVSNLAGPITGSAGAVDGLGDVSRFRGPRALAKDSAGNIYVADRANHLIRKITPAGVVTTLAGSAGESGSTNGTGSDARFNEPSGIAASSDGSVLYVAEQRNHLIRKIVVSGGVGTVSTLAGGAEHAGSANGAGEAARVNEPQGLALDSSGNVFVADFFNNLIRKITPAGVVTTFAPGLELSFPTGLAIDASNNVFVADSGSQVIRKITPAGVATIFAGTLNSQGYLDGSTGLTSKFFNPFDVTLDSAGYLYVADYGNHLIRRITINGDGAAGVVQTLAGTDNSLGAADGVANAARFRNPSGVLALSATKIYVADTGNNTIRRAVPVAPPTITSSLAHSAAVGLPTSYSIQASPFVVSYAASGLPPGLSINEGSGVISGAPLQAGAYAVTIKAVGLGGDATATLTVTVAKGTASIVLGGLSVPYDGSAKTPTVQTTPGSLAVTFTFNGSPTPPTALGTYNVVATINDVNFQGSANGVFEITAPLAWRVDTSAVVQGRTISGIAIAPDGTLYLADATRHVIWKKVGSADPVIFAGALDQPDYQNGTGGNARFDSPSAVAVDAQANVYVSDTNNHSIRKITPGGVVSLLAGGGGPDNFGTDLGAGEDARFYYPLGLAFAPDGTLLVADSGYGFVRRITLGTRAMTNVLPLGSLSQPAGLAVSAAGVIYVSDQDADRILRFEPQQNGAYSLTLTVGSSDGFSDGPAVTSRFSIPRGIALASDGYLYVADANNHAIRRVSPQGEVFTVAGLGGSPGLASGYGADARFNEPSALTLSNDGAFFYVADSGNSLVRRLLAPPSVPVITSALTITAVETQAFSGYSLTATGSPTAFSATGLPLGMTMNAATGVLSGTPLHSGVYLVNASVTNELATVSGTITITVAPPTWTSWLAGHFIPSERSDLLISGPAADPDGDGVPNLMEYYQDRNPKANEGAAAEVATEAGHLVFTYERRRGLAAGVFSVQVSTSLTMWSSGSGHTETVAVQPLDARIELVRERVLAPLSSSPKQFVRLRVSE
ncbi:MAG: MBG domain-containing protein, partial [Rariglobus sp.]